MRFLWAAIALSACDPVWQLSVEVRSPQGAPLSDAVLVLTGCPRQNEHDLGTVATMTAADGTASVGGTGTQYPSCTVTVARPEYRTWQITFDELCGGARDRCERVQNRVVILEPVVSRPR